jgi:putative redox protein
MAGPPRWASLDRSRWSSTGRQKQAGADSGGQLLNLAVAGCISNDLFREAARAGISLHRVGVTVLSDSVGDPALSTPIEYDVELEGEAADDALRELVQRVYEIAEIPNSLRRGTEVHLQSFRTGLPTSR